MAKNKQTSRSVENTEVLPVGGGGAAGLTASVYVLKSLQRFKVIPTINNNLELYNQYLWSRVLA